MRTYTIAAALLALASRSAAQSAFRDLPLIEVAAPQPSNIFAVFVSGDGGWAAMDKGIAAALQKHGVSVVGINAAKYFWRTRTPEGAGADLGLVIRHFLDAWKAESVVVMGYSRSPTTSARACASSC